MRVRISLLAHLAIITLTTTVMMLGSCSFERGRLDACDSDADCFLGERCVQGVCLGRDDGSSLRDASVGDTSTGADTARTDTSAADGFYDDIDVVPPDVGCGLERCEGDVLVGCAADGGEVRTDCTEDCQGAFGCTCRDNACQERFCVPADRICDDADVVECNEVGSGFSLVTACVEPDLCIGGQCAAVVCDTASQRGCVGDVLYECSGSLIPEVLNDCDDDMSYCDEETDACITRICEPEARRCDALGDIVEVCNGEGSAWTQIAECPFDSVCDEGRCVGEQCPPDTELCVDVDILGDCDAAGMLFVDDCSEGDHCEESGDTAACVSGVCEEASRNCVEGQAAYQICDELGSSWGDAIPCEDMQYCADGACQDQTCTPNERRCRNSSLLEVCDENGGEQGLVNCTLDGGFCSEAGVQPDCVTTLCPPGELFCEDNNVARCDDTGSGSVSIESMCDATCSRAECQPASCGDGVVTPSNDETCDDQNALMCDSCESCQRLGHLGLAASSRSGGATWSPGPNDVTLEAWVRATAAGLIMGIGPLTDDRVLLGIDDAGAPYFGMDLEGVVLTRATGPASILDGGWHHLAGCRIDTNGMLLFVDGEFATANGIDSTAQNIDQGGLWLGSPSGSDAAAITGQIDSVRISQGCRYGTPFAPPRTPVADGATIALYQLDSEAGATAFDTSGNTRDLVLTDVFWGDDDCFDSSHTAAQCDGDSLAPWEPCDGGAGCTIDCEPDFDCSGVDETVGLRGECYRFLSATTWTLAEQSCVAWGGHLASVEDGIENGFITLLYDTKTALWIGLTDAMEGKFTWIDGFDGDFRAWAEGEPGGAGGARDCVLMHIDRAGVWSDQGCETVHTALCER